jgi:hypothetical protein
VNANPPDPRIHIDWGGEHVTMRIATGNVQINLSVSHERGKDMIRELQWATSEVERFKNHRGSPDLFVQKPHPEEVR